MNDNPVKPNLQKANYCFLQAKAVADYISNQAMVVPSILEPPKNLKMQFTFKNVLAKELQGLWIMFIEHAAHRFYFCPELITSSW